MKLNCHVILISSFSPNFNVFDSAAELGTCEVIELEDGPMASWVKSVIITVITVHFFDLDLKPVSYFRNPVVFVHIVASYNAKLPLTILSCNKYSIPPISS